MRGLCLSLLVMGCGYRITAPNASLPGGVRKASVPMFQNRTADPLQARTSEPGAEWPFTVAAREQLDRAGCLGGPESEGVLEGTVNSVSSGPVLQAPTLPRQPVFRMTATLSLTLKKGGTSVGSTQVSVAEEYPSGADVLLTELNRAAALRRLAEAAVREGLERLQSAP